MLLQTIYGLFDPAEPSHIRYVGYTKHTPECRLTSHLEEALYIKKWAHTYKNRWVRHVLSSDRSIGIRWLEATSDPDASEKKWISKLKAEGHRLTNGTAGGKGCLGARWKLTPEQVEAIRQRVTEYNRLHPPTPEQVAAFRKRVKGTKYWLGKSLPDKIVARIAAKNRGRVGFWRGKKRSPASTEKMRASLKGRKKSDGQKIALRAYWEKRHRLQAELSSEEFRELYPKRTHCGSGHTGFKHSEETKRHWSEIRKGRLHGVETKRKISKANRGKKRTPEQCACISAGRKAAWGRKKNEAAQTKTETVAA